MPLLADNYIFKKFEWQYFSELIREYERRHGLAEGCLHTKENDFYSLIFRYAVDFLELNKKINLTSIRDLESLLWKQFYDSLLIFKYNAEGSILDIGTGGGFPGIPIIFWRHFFSESRHRIVLLDSIGKKIRAVEGLFQKHAALSNIDTDLISFQVARCESFLLSNRHKVDLAIMRAVAPAKSAVNLLNSSIPRWVIYCGPNSSEDWLRIEKIILNKGFNSIAAHKCEIPKKFGERVFLEISR